MMRKVAVRAARRRSLSIIEPNSAFHKNLPPCHGQQWPDSCLVVPPNPKTICMGRF